MPDELRIVQKQVQLVDPNYTTDQPELQTLLSLVYEPLLRWEDGRILPGLAESWEVSENGREMVLNLRRDAKYHDGKQCTVEDAVAAVEHLIRADGSFGMGGVYAPYLTPLRLQPISPHTLVIAGPEPVADLVDILAAVYVGRYDQAGMPLGTGPYLVDAYEEGKSLRLAAARPGGDEAFRTVTFSAVALPEERLRAVREGAADVATGLEHLPANTDPADLLWQRTTNTLSVTAFLNGSIPPFDRPEARLAINLAVDVHRIISEVWDGLAERASTVVSPYHYGYPPEMSPLGLDPAEAARYFSRVPMPAELVIRTPQVIPDRAPQVAKAIGRDLAAIGIRTRVDEQPDRPLYAREVSQKQIGHIALFDSSPLSTFRVLREKVSSRRRGLWWQGVCDDTADALIAAAHTATQPDERLAAYGACLRWLRDHPHWLYLYHPAKVYAARSGLPPVRMNHGGYLKPPGLTA